MIDRKFSDPDFADVARRNLSDAAQILNAYGATWFIDAGTFLGCVREGGKFLGHDCDLDIGVLDGADLVGIIGKFQVFDFEVYRHYGGPGHGEEWTLKRNGVRLDLFVYYRERQRLWMGCWRDGKLIRIGFDADLILPALTSFMEGVKVRTPFESGGYLSARYGASWRRPDHNYMWDRDSPAIEWNRSEITKEEIEKLWPRHA